MEAWIRWLLGGGPRHSGTYIPEVECLRGLAIGLVFAVHVDYHVRNTIVGGVETSPLGAFMYAGHTGVSLFFVLSGFLLAGPFLAAAERQRPVALSTYARRRARRILPLYYCAVVVATLLVAQTWSDLRYAVPYLLFLNSIPGYATGMHPYSDVWWSLATEVQFYVALPLLGYALWSRATRRASVALLVLYTALYAGFLLGLVRDHTLGGFWLLSLSLFGRAPLFLSGILAAWLYRSYGAAIRSRLASRAWLAAGGADAALLLILAALGCVLQWVSFVGYFAAEAPPRHAWHVLEGSLWMAVLLFILLAPLRLRSVLVNPVMEAIGTLSYSIYLLHFPILHFVFRGLDYLRPGAVGQWNGWTYAVVALAAISCAALSVVTYRVIEAPFLKRPSSSVSAAA